MSNPEGVKIPLVNSDLFATVDEEDAEYVSQYEWFAAPDGVVTFIKDDEGGEHAVYMHDLIAARAGLVD